MRTKRILDFERGVAQNTKRSCEICGKPRHGISRLCNNHIKVKQRFGHPLGKSILKKEFKNELKEVKELFGLNHNHQGIVAAEETLYKLFLSGVTKLSNEREWLYVRDAGVPVREILETVTAVFLFSMRNPKTLPDDIRLNVMMAKQSLSCAPGILRTLKAFRPDVTKYSGLLIRERLLMFFHGVTKALDDMENKRKERIEAYCQPWNTNTTNK